MYLLLFKFSKVLKFLLSTIAIWEDNNKTKERKPNAWTKNDSIMKYDHYLFIRCYVRLVDDTEDTMKKKTASTIISFWNLLFDEEIFCISIAAGRYFFQNLNRRWRKVQFLKQYSLDITFVGTPCKLEQASVFIFQFQLCIPTRIWAA